MCCLAVACPANTTGTTVPSGCSCYPGSVGMVLASATPPYFSENCSGHLYMFLFCHLHGWSSKYHTVPCPCGASVIPCPDRATRIDTSSACTCFDGFAGLSWNLNSSLYDGNCSGGSQHSFAGLSYCVRVLPFQMSTNAACPICHALVSASTQ